eukprot:7413842-Pyramimonas_sp.AAC.1
MSSRSACAGTQSRRSCPPALAVSRAPSSGASAPPSCLLRASALEPSQCEGLPWLAAGASREHTLLPS